MSYPQKPTLVVYTTVPIDHALAYLRFRAPAEQLEWTIIYGKEGESSIYPERVREADFVLIQRDFPRFFSEYQQIIAIAREEKKPIIYDLDDAIFSLPDDHPIKGDYLNCLEYMLLALLDADRVIVSSPLLAEIVTPFNSNVIVWQTYLPDLIWDIKPPSRIENKAKIKIGYMAGLTHLPDLLFLQPILESVQQAYGNQVEFVFWGIQPPEGLFSNVRYQFYPEIQSYPLFAAAFANLQIDIWLAPLKDNIFNRCKSPIKFWEYSAIGGVGIYSRLPPYESVVQPGKNGFLASSIEEWQQAIQILVMKPDAIYQMAQEAQKVLLANGLLSLHVGEWEKIFLESHSAIGWPKNMTTFQEAIYRWATQIADRSEAREAEISRLTQELLILKEHLTQLENRSQQLDSILNSNSWKILQRVHRLWHFNIRPPEVSSQSNEKNIHD